MTFSSRILLKTNSLLHYFIPGCWVDLQEEVLVPVGLLSLDGDGGALDVLQLEGDVRTVLARRQTHQLGTGYCNRQDVRLD